MSFASITLAAFQVAAPVSMDSGFAMNQSMAFQRDGYGNRVVASGASQFTTSSTSRASGVSDGLMPAWGQRAAQGQATAIGNLVSVTITGNNNTVILDTTQINMGDQTAIIGQLPSGAGG